MPRNKEFTSPDRSAPFAESDGIQLVPDSVTGPLPFFNPTRARFHVKQTTPSSDASSDGPRKTTQVLTPNAQLQWRARDNRKGRHALVIDDSRGAAGTSNVKALGRGLRRMCTECPYWDVSYLIAVFFTVGCLIFIACGLFSWLPIAYPDTAFPQEGSVAGGVTAFVGATLFEVGAVLLVFEACNENQTGCFGWALYRALSSHHATNGGNAQGEAGASDSVLAKADKGGCKHHHQNSLAQQPTGLPQPERQWEWWPSWRELKTHYIHEIGFVASVSLSLGATIFYVSGICSLPGIYNNLSLGVIQGVYLFTYLFGGVIFIFSSVLYVLENQPNWYTPAPRLLGWHIGVWNLIGSIGWTLAASFGYCTADWCAYQSELTLIWASAAFFIGSALLWYEALDKYPVVKETGSSQQP